MVETIRICRDRNVLREYLQGKEKEVVTIMMSLFDEEEIMKMHIMGERQEAKREGERETAKRMLKAGKLSLEEIAEYVPSLPMEELKELKTEVTQLA